MTTPRKKAVLFDVDGVLIDSPPVHVESWKYILKPYRINLPDREIHLWEGRKAEEVLRDLFRQYHLPGTEAALQDLIRLKREFYQRFAPTGLREEAVTCIAQLREKGIKIAMVSGSARENISTVVKEPELGLFDVVVTADDYTHAKPDPEPYLIGCNRLGISPEEGIAVENAPLGVQSAVAAGLTVIGLLTTLPPEDLEEAHYLMKSLDTVTHLLLG